MKKPQPETYGFVHASSPEEQGGWTIEHGEEAYYEALERWSIYKDKHEAAAIVDCETLPMPDIDVDLPF